ncbi:MAG: hypothetical protein JW910_09555 [Anaerolineae bacterium]|nr:hypothetical protein [Anaerolineae bacterium]
MTTFIPDKLLPPEQAVPFFEDSQKMDIPGRGTKKSVKVLQGEIVGALGRLGAGVSLIVPGTVSAGEHTRCGFQIQFVYGGLPGRIDCVALPIRNESPRAKDRALAQALYLLRDELLAMALSAMHKPGAVPLLPYLIGSGGKTVTEALVESQQIPQMPQPMLLSSGG